MPSDDKNRDFDAELDRELQLLFHKRVKYNIRNELVSILVGAETSVRPDEKYIRGHLRQQKHQDEPDDPLRKQLMH